MLVPLNSHLKVRKKENEMVRFSSHEMAFAPSVQSLQLRVNQCGKFMSVYVCVYDYECIRSHCSPASISGTTPCQHTILLH